MYTYTAERGEVLGFTYPTRTEVIHSEGCRVYTVDTKLYLFYNNGALKKKMEETQKAEFAILAESRCWMVSRKGNLCKKGIFSASRENPR